MTDLALYSLAFATPTSVMMTLAAWEIQQLRKSLSLQLESLQRGETFLHEDFRLLLQEEMLWEKNQEARR